MPEQIISGSGTQYPWVIDAQGQGLVAVSGTVMIGGAFISSGTVNQYIQQASALGSPIASGANIFASFIGPQSFATLYRVQATFAASGTLAARVSGASIVNTDLNSSSSLSPNALYAFDIMAGSNQTVNFVYNAATTGTIIVTEIRGGV